MRSGSAYRVPQVRLVFVAPRRSLRGRLESRPHRRSQLGICDKMACAHSGVRPYALRPTPMFSFTSADPALWRSARMPKAMTLVLFTASLNRELLCTLSVRVESVSQERGLRFRHSASLLLLGPADEALPD